MLGKNIPTNCLENGSSIYISMFYFFIFVENQGQISTFSQMSSNTKTWKVCSKYHAPTFTHNMNIKFCENKPSDLEIHFHNILETIQY